MRPKRNGYDPIPSLSNDVDDGRDYGGITYSEQSILYNFSNSRKNWLYNYMKYTFQYIDPNRTSVQDYSTVFRLCRMIMLTVIAVIACVFIERFVEDASHVWSNIKDDHYRIIRNMLVNLMLIMRTLMIIYVTWLYHKYPSVLQDNITETYKSIVIFEDQEEITEKLKIFKIMIFRNDCQKK